MSIIGGTGVNAAGQPTMGVAMPVPIPQVRRVRFNDERVGMGFNSQSGWR
jgi:hypothetical protein